MKNYFKSTKEHPYHLSIGAVVLNEKDEVCCHFFKKETDYKSYKGMKDFYILMRETMEMGETIEETLHRGLMEEFGITGEIIDFIGSIKANYSIHEVSIEKTTLYFLVRMKSFDLSRRSKEDAERGSEIMWKSIDFLIDKMKKQGIDLTTTLDESTILEKVKLFK